MNLRIGFLIFLILPIIVFSQNNSKLNLHKGNENFLKRNYEESNHFYSKSLQENPKQFDAHYNLGNALYKQKKYEESYTEFAKAKQFTKNKADLFASNYNQANAYFQKKNYEKALENYKNALKLEPNNPSALKNYEIAKLKMQEQKKQEQESKENQKKEPDNKSDNEKQKEEQDSSDKQKNKKNPGSDNQENKGDQNINNKQAKHNNQSKAYDKISKEVEKDILNQIDGLEKQTARRIINKKASLSEKNNQKDW